MCWDCFSKCNLLPIHYPQEDTRTLHLLTGLGLACLGNELLKINLYFVSSEWGSDDCDCISTSELPAHYTWEHPLTLRSWEPADVSTEQNTVTPTPQCTSHTLTWATNFTSCKHVDCRKSIQVTKNYKDAMLLVWKLQVQVWPHCWRQETEDWAWKLHVQCPRS